MGWLFLILKLQSSLGNVGGNALAMTEAVTRQQQQQKNGDGDSDGGGGGAGFFLRQRQSGNNGGSEAGTETAKLRQRARWRRQRQQQHGFCFAAMTTRWRQCLKRGWNGDGKTVATGKEAATVTATARDLLGSGDGDAMRVER